MLLIDIKPHVVLWLPDNSTVRVVKVIEKMTFHCIGSKDAIRFANLHGSYALGDKVMLNNGVMSTITGIEHILYVRVKQKNRTRFVSFFSIIGYDSAFKASHFSNCFDISQVHLSNNTEFLNVYNCPTSL
jgi:hypothetical protein